MCNQTEMYKEIAEYDRRASVGLEHTRGIAHNPSSCLKCKSERKKKPSLKKKFRTERPSRFERDYKF